MKKRPKQIILFLSIIVLLYAAISILLLGRSLQLSLQVKQDADRALASLDAGDYDAVLAELVRMEGNITSARYWQRFSVWAGYLPMIGSDYQAYEELLTAGEQISTSLGQVLRELTQTSISKNFSLETLDLQSAPAAYLGVHDEVMLAIDHLVAADEHLQELHLQFVPEAYRPSLLQLQSRVASFALLAKEYRPLLELLPELLGKSSPHQILFLLQNPHELRPTGGFIGTYGRMTIDSGIISQFYTEDVYNLDVNILGAEEYQAPPPLQKYTNVPYWYLRDANWSPDFPTAAAQVKKLYESESKGDAVDMIAAITPYPIEEFLKLTGPIEVDGILFTNQNLIDAIQFRVEQDFWQIGLSDEERKSVINHLAQALKQRLFHLKGDELKSVFAILQESLARKHILLHAENKEVQDYFVSQNWDGAVSNQKTDYLYVVDANLGALKTDRVVDRRRRYQLIQNEDGTWKARLEISYTNNGFFDYRTTRYRTYTRIYVPIGSQLIYSSGFVTKDKSSDYIQPEQYAEFDKTVFAGFLSVEPNQTRFAVIEYLLPPWLQEQINQEGVYTLLVQKQPGVDSALFHADFTFVDKLFSLVPSRVDYTLVNENQLRFTDRLTHDNEYKIHLTP